MRWFGLHLEFGRYVERDVCRAACCYQSAALKGDPDSESDFGFCLEHGLGVEQDLLESVRQYRQSADGGSAKGQFQLSLSLQYGVGCDVDLDEAASFCGQSGPETNNAFRCRRGLNKAAFPVLRTIASKASGTVQEYESTPPAARVPPPLGNWDGPVMVE
jgi:TPR repeat protein